MFESYKPYIIAFSFLAGSVVIGFLLEKLLMVRLRKVARKTRWKGDDLLVSSLRGIVVFISIIIGSYIAVWYMPDNKTVEEVAGKTMFILITFTITLLVSRLAVALIKAKTGHTEGIIPSTSIIANIIRITLYIMGILVVLQSLGISVTPVLTALGVGGLAVALALQDTLSNLFSGIQIIASKKIRIGDYIKLATGEEGNVVDISWRNTIIQMLSNNVVVIPNSKIASTILINYNLPDKETAVLVEVGVGYQSDLEKVERVTVDAAKKVISTVEGGIKNFDPFIRYHTFKDSNIAFTVILRGTEFTSQYLIKHEFIKALYKAYKTNNIEIAYPVRTVIMKNNQEV